MTGTHAHESSIATTTAGRVAGSVLDNGIHAFVGMPFAAPPTGANRFLPPQAVTPWADVRDATVRGATPPQSKMILNEQLPPQDEDCLTLSVWTPGLDEARRPVMVWIHGGGFSVMAANDPATDGDRLAAAGDVVVVAIEYRAGVLGFGHLADHFGDAYADSGVNGLRDQIAGLEWVRDNVAAFGGDPDNVCVFGESAGAMSIGCLLGMPAAQGLFHKAILQSGAAHHHVTAEFAGRAAARFLEEIGVAPGDRERLAAVDVADIVAAQERTVASAREWSGDTDEGPSFGLALPFSPVVGTTSLPTEPLDAIAAGSAAGVTVLIGTTNDEWNLFSQMLKMPVPNDTDKLVRRLARTFGGGESVITPELVAKTYLLARPEAKVHQVSSAVYTDVVFRIPALRLAEAQLGHTADVWMYRFDFASPLFDGRLGACHAIELPFVFDPRVEAGALGLLAGIERPAELTRRTQELWTSFARTGVPTAADAPAWPRYDVERRATLLLDTDSVVADDPGADERVLWIGVL